MITKRYAFVVLLLLIGAAIGWQGTPISQLAPITVDSITDDTLVHFGIAKTDVGRSYRLSLAELKKTMATVSNIKQYGAIGNWDIDAETGNDDSIAIQTAIDATPAGGALFIPDGYYRFTGADITKPITIYGPGVLVVGVNEYGFDVDLSTYWGNVIELTASVDYQISASATPVTTQLTSAAAHGLAQGDVIKITTEYSYFTGNFDYEGEICKVIKVIDTTNFVVDREFPDWNLAVVEAHFRKMPTGRINIQANFDTVSGGEETERTTEAPLIFLNGAIDPVIEVNAVNSYSTVVHCCSLFKGDIKVRTGEIDGLSTVNSILLTGGNPLNEKCRGVQLNACHGTSVQSLVGGGQTAVLLDMPNDEAAYATTIAFMQDMGANRHISVHDSISHGSYQAGFICHIGCFDTTFDNCQAISNALLDTTHSAVWPVGFVSGGWRTDFYGCRAKGGRFGWYVYGDVYNSGYESRLVGCMDDDITEISINADYAATKLTALEIIDHSSKSNCQFLSMGGGTYFCRNCSIRQAATVTGATFQMNSGSANLVLENMFHIMGGTTDYGCIIQVDAGVTNANLIVDNYYMLSLDAGVCDSFLSTGAGSALRVDVNNISYQTSDHDGLEQINFPAEHLIDDSNAGTITMVSDKFRQNGVRHEFGTAAPASERHEVGDIVWHSAPAAGGNIGWVCTTAGTPGTWKTFGDVAP